MSDDSRVYYKRTFLNAEEGIAAIESYVYNHSYDKKDGDRQFSLDGNFQITDCSRSVTLDFCVDDEESLARAVQKANRLMHALEDFRDALVKTAKREGIRR